MYKTILFDLDDTLLRIQDTLFIEAYFKTLMPKLVDFFPDGGAQEAILYGTQAMLQSTNPEATMRDVFTHAFEKASGIPFKEIEPVFLNYYETDFALVQKVTGTVPNVRKALDLAFSIAPNVVVATVPIFPHVAIHERLKWAGVDDYPFKLVTSFELMHASKPHIDYYQEIVAMLGVEPSECLMIGNDWVDDLPAGQLGMDTWLVSDFEKNYDIGKLTPKMSGSFQEMVQYLETISEN